VGVAAGAGRDLVGELLPGAHIGKGQDCDCDLGRREPPR
jgi:hypothetical protein